MTKKRLLILLKIAVSGGLIWFLLSTIDVSAVKARLAAAEPVFLVLAAGVFLVQISVAGGRWWVVLQAIGAPMRWLDLTRLFWIGAFFSQALPSSVGGDPIRMYMAYKEGLPLGKAVNGVMLERAVTIVGLVALVIAIQPVFLPKLDEGARKLTLSAVALLTLGAVVGLTLVMNLDRLPEKLMRFRLIRGVAALAGDTRAVFLSVWQAPRAIAFGVLTHVVIALAVFFLARALDVGVTWLDCMVLMPPVILVTTVPISIAGWGVREGAMVTAFALVGVPADAALALSLMIGFVGIVMMSPGGVLWLAGRRRGEAVSAAAAEAAVERRLEEEQGPDRS